ncbi:MAG TPA: hypothetical protein VIJ39_11690 [Solirubrobacteraceae bacterium]
MRDSSLGRLALAARHPPLWARWLLTVVAFAVLILVAVIVVHDNSEGSSAPTRSEREAEVEANREGNVVVEEDQAPHSSPLRAGVSTRVALELAIATDARGRIRRGELTGPLQSVHCRSAGQPRAGRQAFHCTARSAGISYPFLGVLDEPMRELTWCKVDPSPVGSAPEVPVSPRCRT